VGFGITLTATKGLTRTEPPITILFYMLATQLEHFPIIRVHSRLL
jgi:hypothetical protein